MTSDNIDKYQLPVVKPRPDIHPAQIAAEQAALRGKDPNKAYNDTLKQMGEKPELQD